MTNKELNKRIHKRDNDECIICHTYVDIGEKWHHEPCGIHKQNKVDKGVLLCYKCHQERHFGKRSQEIKRLCEEYLSKLYGGV